MVAWDARFHIQVKRHSDHSPGRNCDAADPLPADQALSFEDQLRGRLQGGEKGRRGIINKGIPM